MMDKMDKNAFIYGLIIFGIAIIIALGANSTGSFVKDMESQGEPLGKFVMQVCVNDVIKTYQDEVGKCTTELCLRDSVLHLIQNMDDCELEYILSSTSSWDAGTIIDAWDGSTVIDCYGSPY